MTKSIFYVMILSCTTEISNADVKYQSNPNIQHVSDDYAKSSRKNTVETYEMEVEGSGVNNALVDMGTRSVGGGEGSGDVSKDDISMMTTQASNQQQSDENGENDKRVAVSSINKNVAIAIAITIGTIIVISQIGFIIVKKRRSQTIQYERGDVLLTNSNYRETEILEEEPDETENLLFAAP